MKKEIHIDSLVIMEDNLTCDNTGVPEHELKEMRNNMFVVDNIDSDLGGWYKINGWFFRIEHIKHQVTPKTHPEYFV
jgi:hypothetical protein